MSQASHFTIFRVFIWRFQTALLLSIIETVNHWVFSESSEYFGHFGILGVGAVPRCFCDVLYIFVMSVTPSQSCKIMPRLIHVNRMCVNII